MAKAKRYIKDDTKRIEVLNVLIDEGYIKTWAAIFDDIPRSTVAAHRGFDDFITLLSSVTPSPAY
jgi:hypothetical protein